MDFNEYQEQALATATYPQDQAVVYNTLALSGEAGELANKVKKIMRGDKELTPDVVEELMLELGDCLWYMANLADVVGWKLEDVAQLNLVKLSTRRKKGTIRGDGDHR
jgi:NTP pyrophosphatase (non-canonical NTP hydrolase)